MDGVTCGQLTLFLKCSVEVLSSYNLKGYLPFLLLLSMKAGIMVFVCLLVRFLFVVGRKRCTHEQNFQRHSVVTHFSGLSMQGGVGLLWGSGSVATSSANSGLFWCWAEISLAESKQGRFCDLSLPQGAAVISQNQVREHPEDE